jgi:hypothetical protein
MSSPTSTHSLRECAGDWLMLGAFVRDRRPNVFPLLSQTNLNPRRGRLSAVRRISSTDSGSVVSLRYSFILTGG